MAAAMPATIGVEAETPLPLKKYVLMFWAGATISGLTLSLTSPLWPGGSSQQYDGSVLLARYQRRFASFEVPPTARTFQADPGLRTRSVDPGQWEFVSE